MVPRSESDEYVQITNTGEDPQQLLGWLLRDRDDERQEFVFPARTLNPGDIVRVYTNEVHPQWGGFSFRRGTAIWHNEDPDRADLYDERGVLVSSKTYPPGC